MNTEDYTVPQLKEKLEKAGLSTEGLKADLVARWDEHLAAEALKAEQSAEAPKDGPADGPTEGSTEGSGGDDAGAPPAPAPVVGGAVGEAPLGGLFGSSFQPSHVAIGGNQVQLGEAVAAAFAKSGLTGNAWNALDSAEREALIAAEIDPPITATVDSEPVAEEDRDTRRYKYVPTSGQHLNVLGGVPPEGLTFEGRQPGFEAFVGVYFTVEELDAEEPAAD
jgi:hypothetical protein